jgi:hypothetical protein
MQCCFVPSIEILTFPTRTRAFVALFYDCHEMSFPETRWLRWKLQQERDAMPKTGVGENRMPQPDRTLQLEQKLDCKLNISW